MARIELSFYDKKFTIEYNRASVKDFLKIKNKEDQIDQAIALIKCGLQMHHAHEMPSDDEIIGWVFAMGGDLEKFASTLQEMVQGVITTLEGDRKNLKWGKVD